MLQNKKNILISTPSYIDSLVYLPYVHALLKTFCEKDDNIKTNFNWLEPVFLNNTAEALLAGRETQIDILGLSCYLWNWSLQLQIARRVKAANPNCLIVMGGPHPDWKDEDFFLKHPDVDIVVKNEGEQPFHLILTEYLKDNPNYKSISSLMVRGADEKVVHTGPPMRLEKWDEQSVWQTEDMKSLAEKYYGKFKIAAVWETNRGCPYQCSFCDWGSATYSKMRLLPDARLEADLEFFGKYKVLKIFIADSNFGMFPRDINLANRVVYYKKNFGFPTLVYWATAKNKAEPVLEIAKAFLDNELDDSIAVSMQSTHEKTVVEMGRGAHSLQTHKKLSRMIDEIGAPKIVQVILGSPEESCQEFKDSLHGLLKLNFHRSFFVMNYAILPNAPIAEASEMKRHGIQTITRPANRTWGYRQLLWKWKSGLETIIVGHNNMSPQDWVEMSMYKTHIMCLHHLGLTKFLSRLLMNIKAVSYKEFYEFFFNKAMNDQETVGESYRKIQYHFSDYLRDEDGIYALPGIDPEWYIDQEAALFCWMIVKHEELKQWIAATTRELAAQKNLDAEFVEEALQFQLNMIITPDYNYKTGKTFTSEYDFYGYFSELKDWDREVFLDKKKTLYKADEHNRDLKDQILNFNWLDSGKIDLNSYQHSAIVGPYRRYMHTPVFNKLHVL